MARSTHTVPVVEAAPAVPTAPEVVLDVVPDVVLDVELVGAVPRSSSICAEMRAIAALLPLADALEDDVVDVGDVVVVGDCDCALDDGVPLVAGEDAADDVADVLVDGSPRCAVEAVLWL